MRIVAIEHLQGASLSLHGSSISDMNVPSHAMSTSLPSAKSLPLFSAHSCHLSLPTTLLRASRKVPLSPYMMNDCGDDRFCPPLSVRPPPNPPPYLSLASLIELLLLHSTILAQPLTALTVLSTALLLLALPFTFVAYKTA